MKAHTSDFKEQIKQFGRELDSKITYEIGNEEIELGKEELNSVSPHYEGAILKSVMKQLDIDSNVEIPTGTILRYQFGVKVSGEYEYIDFGNYVVYSIEKQEDTNSYKIVCYDKMLYAMKEYENSDIAFPITIKEYLEAICDKIDLEYEESPFANSEKIISNELFLDSEGRSMNYTFRDVLDQIAEASGGTICINKDDKLEVRYIHDVGEITDVSNSNIEITDGEEAELQTFELEGKTAQASTPTPDNPSELNSVGYENLLDFSQIINNTNRGLTWNYETGKLNITGTATATYSQTNQFNINLPSGTYKFNSFGDTNLPYNIWLYNSNGTLIGNTKVNNPVTINETATKFALFVENLTSGTSYNESITVQITRGTQSHSYIPYGKYGIEVKTTGKNLFDANNYNLLNAYYVDGTGKVVYGSNNRLTWLKLQPNTTYILTQTKVSNVNRRVALFSSQPVANLQGTLLGTFSGTNPIDQTFTTSDTNIYLGFVYCNLANLGTYTEQEMVDSIQVEQGNTATEYEVYKENTQLYQLDEPLRSIGDTKDLLYIKNGMLYVDRKIESITFDGNSDESWGLLSGTHKFYINLNRSLNNYYKMYSDYYTYISSGQGALNDGEFTNIGGLGTYLWFRNDNCSDVNAFKTWLSTHNTNVCLPLETPYTEEIGQVQMPSTYDGTTYIQTTDLLEPTMNVSYISEFEEIDEEYLKDVNVNFGEKYGAINTIVLSRGGDADKISASIPADLPDEDKVAIQITDNQIMNGNDRNEYMAGILNQLYGLEYYINDFTSTGICYLDLCDRYRIKIGDTSYKCVMFNDEVNITQGLVENIYTDMPEESEQEYKYMNSTDRGITQANIIAKKNEATITSYTQRLDDVTGRLNAVETKQTATDVTIGILGTNIDDNGNITAVKVKEGYTFDENGFQIYTDDSSFKTLIDETGTYYYDGNSVTGQYTKDGSKQKDLQLFGVYYYGMDDIDDDAMFVAQLYTDENGDEGFGHFYNRGD